MQDGYLYSRWGNPTVDSACDVLTKLEGAAGSILFASGCSAITTTLFSFLKAGDHLVLQMYYCLLCCLVESIAVKFIL